MLFLLSECFVSQVDSGSVQLLCTRHLVVLREVFVCYLKHLVDEATHSRSEVAVADQQVCCIKTRVKEDWIVLILHSIKLLNDLKDLIKDIICKRVTFFLEVI